MRVPPGPEHSPDTQNPWGAQRSLSGPRLRLTIRVRLTLLYGGLFLLAGMVLLSIIYLLAAQALQGSGTAFRIHGGYELSLSSDVCPELGQARNISEFNGILDACLQAQRTAVLSSLLRRSLVALLALAVLAFAFGYVMAGRVLSPLGRITRTARGVAGSDLGKRIELDGPDDELKELADTFDEMLDRLDRAFNAQKRFVANASHELRTPLAINRTLLEVQMSDPDASVDLRQLGRALLATNERSERLVEGLLLLARSENELSERSPVDMAEVVTQAVDQVRAEAGTAKVELRLVLEPVRVQGNGVLLERVALNLVQNAIRYNVPEGGWVRVATSTTGDGHALLRVENTGPVVPVYQVDDLFEPFRRLRGDRTGSGKGAGLGLSIVRSVAHAHGGAAAATPRGGGGLTVDVRVPVR
nr:HAMP domain-containing sensor histidine kinase [Streptomyces durbertensis]